MGREKEKTKDKEKEKDKDSSKDKEKEKDKDKDKDKEKDKDHKKKDKKKSSKSSKRSRSRSRSRSRDRRDKKKRRRSSSRERSRSKSRDRKHKKKDKEREKEKDKTTTPTESSTATTTSTSTTSTTSTPSTTSTSTEPSPKRIKTEHTESKSPTPTSTPPITDEEKEKRDAAESAALETDLERRRQRAREWQQQMKAKKEAEEKLAEEQAKKHAEMKEKEDDDDDIPIKMETETSEPSLPPLTPTSDASLPPLSSTSSTDVFPTPSLVNKKKPGGFQFSAFGAKTGTSASSSTSTATSTPSKTASPTVKMEIKPSKPSTSSAFDTATTKTPPPKPVVEEEIDPLDAFMASLAGSMTESEKRALAGKSTVEQEQQEAQNEANADAIEKQHLEDEKRSEQAAARLTEGTKSVLEKITAAATSTTPSTGKKAPTRVQLPAAIPSSVTKGKEERFYNDDETMDETDLDAIAAASEEPSWLASSSTRAKKKDIKTVDHSKQNYIPFRKNFYIESRDITNMTEEEVKEYREKDLEGVKIRGVNCPRPVKEWIQCGLPSKIYDVIQKEGYAKPFPIQCQTLPIIMSGRDCIGCAKTGSGKTLAFVLPMIRHILDQPPLELTDGPIGLIMAPTRELVVQIHNETRKFAKACNLRCVCVYGGAGVAEQIANLKRGAEIIVATPGRFIDILCANSGRVTNLRRVTYVVLDEADRMFDMGFEPQIMRILDNIRPDRQTVMFSATFPTSVEKLARKALKTPIEIMIGGRSVASTNITQIVEVRTDETKFSRLLEILGKWYSAGSILIFVDRQEAVDNLFRRLIDSGYPCLALHGGMNQDDRDFTISDFKSGIRTLMVSTSVVARGLDIKDLILVINYEVPNHYEDYIHRVGRTGRGTKKGTAITFIEPDQIKHAPDLIKALTSSKQIVPADLQKMADEFNAKVASGEIKYATQGFGGKGFKFDEKEEERRLAKEQQQRLGIMAAEGLEVNMPEIEVVTEEEEKKENKEEKATTTTTTTPATPAIPTGPPTPATIAATTAAALKAKMQQEEEKKKSTQSLLAKQLKAARQAALGIEADKSAPVPLPPGAPPPVVLAITDGSEKKTATATAAPAEKPESEMTEEEKAVKRAQALKARLTKINQEQAIINAKKAAEALVAKLKPATPVTSSTALVTTGPMGGVGQTVVQGVDGKPIITYFAELEINDYPQHARWKVTHKESLREILDEFDCAITTKGSYVQPGRAPPPGERKLYLLIDGKEEQDVARCKHAVYLMVEEAAKDSMSRPGADAKPAYGKYSVV